MMSATGAAAGNLKGNQSAIREQGGTASGPAKVRAAVASGLHDREALKPQEPWQPEAGKANQG